MIVRTRIEYTAEQCNASFKRRRAKEKPPEHADRQRNSPATDAANHDRQPVKPRVCHSIKPNERGVPYSPNREWPIRTNQPQLPPPKFVFSDSGPAGSVRRGEAHDSMVCQGCIISGGHVSRSVLSPNVRVNSYAVVESSLLFDGVEVGRHCKIRKTIIDKDVKIPAHTTIGYNLDHDRQRGFTVTDQGVVVIAKAELPETFAQR